MVHIDFQSLDVFSPHRQSRGLDTMYSLRLYFQKKSFCFLHLNKLDYHDSVSTRIHGPASILFQFAFPPKDLNPLFGVYEYNKTGT